MLLPFKSRLSVSRQRLEFFYSIAVMVLVPAILMINTLWLLDSFREVYDTELRRKANLANEILGASVADAFTPDNKALQTRVQSALTRVKQRVPEVTSASLAVPSGAEHKVLASTSQQLVGKAMTDVQTYIVWAKKEPVAALVRGSTEAAEREWRVITPVTDTTGKMVAVSYMSVSLKDSDELVQNLLYKALLVAAVTVGLLMLLLYNHFRFVEYASLFRKQKELDQMKDDFISVATHELKSPMTVIRGYIDTVLQGDTGKIPAEAKSALAIAMDQTNKLNELIKDLLDVSRLEQGRAQFNIAAVPLSGSLEPLVATYGKKAKDKGLELVYDKPAGNFVIQADAARLSEIFTNLIDNAIKYTEQGTVRVSAAAEGGKAVVKFSDSGIGMTPDEQGRLFNRFYRAKNEKTANISGTGLGLWILRQYLEKMGGSINVQSEFGKGSTFTVTLPLGGTTTEPAQSRP